MNTITLARVLELKSTYLREDMLRMLLHSGSGHTGGSFSAVDIFNVLYNGNILNHNLNSNERDRLLSAGHKAPALVSVLADIGYIEKEEAISTYRDFGSICQGHIEKRLPGVDISTGSLGQIISVGCGMAYGFKSLNMRNKVYVFVGDGELQEGQNWEAAMSASMYRLSNLCVIVDNNRLQIDGPTHEVMPVEPIEAKFEAFGWQTARVQLHSEETGDINYEALLNSLNSFRNYKGDKPTVIIADTIKAFGVPSLQGKVSSHGVAPTKQQADEAFDFLGKRRSILEGNLEIPSSKRSCFIEVPARTEYPPLLLNLAAPEFSAFSKGKSIATREAYGAVLAYLAQQPDIDLYVLDSDLAQSTKACLLDKLEMFDKRRHIDLGIAEQNMIGWLAGLAATASKNKRRIVFASSFGIFIAGRAYEQIRNTVAYSELDANLVGTHAGIVTGADGGTHQTIEDIALMRVIPGMQVFSPADVLSAVKSLEAAINYQGPAYVRLCREPTKVIYTKDTVPYPYKAKRLIFSDDDKASILSTGHMLQYALEAQEMLQQRVNARVYDFTTVKPLDTDSLHEASKIGPIITLEDHYTYGGFGEAVASSILEIPALVPVRKIGVKDRFGQSGKAMELLNEYGMSSSHIAEAVLQSVREYESHKKLQPCNPSTKQ